MKLSHLKNIIKEELARMHQNPPLRTEKALKGCSGTCSVTVNGETFTGTCKGSAFSAFCTCEAGSTTVDCDNPEKLRSADRTRG